MYTEEEVEWYRHECFTWLIQNSKENKNFDEFNKIKGPLKAE